MKRHRARRGLLGLAMAFGLVLAGGPSVGSAGAVGHTDKTPLRILCLSASATQMLYAIGAGPDVVAVDKYSTYPKQAPRTRLTGYEASAEDYLKYSPDLVVMAFNEGTMVQQLQKLHIAALVLPPATGLAGVYSQLKTLGQATGRTAGAARAAAALRRHVAAAVSSAGRAGRGQTYYLELSPKPLYTATSKTFVGAELSLFGLRDIADTAAHGPVTPCSRLSTCWPGTPIGFSWLTPSAAPLPPPISATGPASASC